MGRGKAGERCRNCIKWVHKDKSFISGRCTFFDVPMYPTDCCILFVSTKDVSDKLNKQCAMLNRMSSNLGIEREMLSMFEDPDGSYPVIKKGIEEMISIKLGFEHPCGYVNKDKTDNDIIAEINRNIKIYIEDHFKHLHK